MTALAICFAALAGTYWAGRRSLGWGLVALCAVGYFYGILRANTLSVFSHFFFDSACIGLYLSQLGHWSDNSKQSRMIRGWTMVLIGWPMLVALMPFQPLLISLVGLRGNIFFLPALLLGSRLKDRDILSLSYGLAVLNLAALGFAGAEYFLGVPRFYPISPVTTIIYASGDVEGGFLRIPAIFANAHNYGGTMVCTLPYLIGAWSQRQKKPLRLLALLGIAAAMLGILLSATRLNFIMGVLMLTASLLATRAKATTWFAIVLMIAAAGWTAATNPRFQRFKSLSDTEYVGDRIAGSLSRTFWEILTEYPMGNGLGGGGTSIPYFLEGQVRSPIGLENEYARLLCEQGIIGLVLWLGFVVWFLARFKIAFAKGKWANTRRIAWCHAAACLGTAWIGLGLLTSIPQSALVLLAIGWTSTTVLAEDKNRTDRKAGDLAERRQRSLVYTG